MSLVDRIPVLDFDQGIEGPSFEDFRVLYDLAQCVRFQTKHPGRKNKRKREASTACALDSICKAYASATPKDQESWTIETTTAIGSNFRRPSETTAEAEQPPTPLEFLAASRKTANGYCSFVLQDDSRRAVSDFTQQLKALVHENTSTETTKNDINPLPFSLLWTIDDESGTVVSIAPHYWIFAGRNRNKNDLRGRAEHTDDIAHDGTVHYQLDGKKIWKLRPTQELRDRCDVVDVALLDSYEVVVAKGECLCINTHLWWHQTVIPAASANGGDSCFDVDEDDSSWSISVARDVYLGTKPTSTVDQNSNNDDSDGDGALEKEQSESMSNKETSWASGFIPMGTKLLVDHPEINDDDSDDDNNDDDMEPDAIPLKFYQFLPPTLEQTSLEDKANCIVILQSESSVEKQLALKTSKDIQEGQEFVVFVPRQEIDDESSCKG